MMCDGLATRFTLADGTGDYQSYNCALSSPAAVLAALNQTTINDQEVPVSVTGLPVEIVGNVTSIQVARVPYFSYSEMFLLASLLPLNVDLKTEETCCYGDRW